MAFDGGPAAFGPRVGRMRCSGARLGARLGARGAKRALRRKLEQRSGNALRRPGDVALGLAGGDGLPSPGKRGCGPARGARGLVKRRLEAVRKRAHIGRIATREATG